MKITADELRALGARHRHIAVFESAWRKHIAVFEGAWPNGAEVTVENALRALKMRIPLACYAVSALPQRAWKVYDRAVTLACEAYCEARVPARERCQKAAAAAGDACQEAEAWKPYWKVAAAAWEAYQKAEAAAFVEACLQGKESVS